MSPHQQDSLKQTACSHSSTVEPFMAKTAFTSWRWTFSELSRKLSLTTSVQPAQCCTGAPTPAHILEVIHLHQCNGMSPANTVSAWQVRQAECHADSASGTPVSYPLRVGGHPETGPTLPANSFTSSWQPGGHPPVRRVGQFQ